MSIGYTSPIDYQSTVYHYSSESTSKNTSKTAAVSNGFKDIIKESVIDDYKLRNPDHARHVDKQVKAGRTFLEKNGLDSSVTENMTMEEYQAYIYALIDKIPYDYTRQNDTYFVSISDRGWEQMRKDPKYEAWIIGYLVEDRSIRNPFYAWGNNAGNVVSERFGASINEHIGQSVSKAVFKDNSSDHDDDDEEDWWIKRHKRMKKLLKEQVERTMKADAAQKAALWDEYNRQQYISAQRRQSFLETGTPETPFEPTLGSSSAANAAAAYTSVIDLFGAAGAPIIDS